MKSRFITWCTALALTGSVFIAATPAHAAPDDQSSLTILATTDVHAHLLNWDYFADAAYPDSAAKKQPLGLANVSTIVKDVRAARSSDSVVVVDNGDYVQGTPLSYLSAVHPEKLSGSPLPEAMNLIGYDAQNLGNHEFNYGLPYLNGYKSKLNAPLLGANVIDAASGAPAFPATTMLTKTVAGKQVKVGIVGVVTQGVAVWDKANVSGKLTFADPVKTADRYATELKAAGADVVVVLAHMGLDSPADPYVANGTAENASSSIAKLAKNVDVVVSGHTHLDAPQTLFDGASGHKVLVSQAFYWARGVADIKLPLSFDTGSPKIDYAAWSATPIYARSVAADPAFTSDAVIKNAHDATVAYVNSKVGTSTQQLTTETSRYEDTPILDFIGAVQVDTVEKALAKTKYAGVPVITEVSPFSRTSVFPQGDLKIRDIAGLYVFDNTLGAISLTGKQVKEYLEWSARYFVQTARGATFDPATGTNAVYGGANPIPDYNYDALSGVTYSIDVSKPVGERIVDLRYTCKPVGDNDPFVMALNNYRMSGAGAAAFVKDAPVVYNELQEIRQLLIDHATEVKTIDPKDFYVKNWQLTTTGEAFVDPACAATASVTITPTSVAPGGAVQVSGQGFQPDEKVRIELHSTPTVLATVLADASGNVAAKVTIPSVESGPHQIVLIGEGSGRQASAPLTITKRMLPVTGGESDLAVALTGLLVVLMGGGVLAARRRVSA